jgi:lipoprotein-anchoring transpeptidase ErfK/SrfK
MPRKTSAVRPLSKPIVTSAHLVSPDSAQMSEFEFGLIVAGNAFHRWVVHCMSAAGLKDLTPLDVLVLHHVTHRARDKRLADICFIMNIEDTHLVNYALKKLQGLGVVASRKHGKEVTYAATEAAPTAQAQAPRGPAVRMIASEEVQPLPAATAPAASSPFAYASNDPFVIKSILPIEGSIRYGDWFWDESAAPKSGKLVITVDLEARVISAFRDGHEIGTAVALLGTRAHPTPVGTFPILSKERDNVSEKYNDAPMPWTLRLTWEGIAIHGSPVLNGYASHGCIGVPDHFAAKLFAAAGHGDKVIITRGRMVGVGDKVL